MSDGRVIFTAEKRAPDFYQLAGRRINLDGGDYHPLFGQRSTIGYNQFTDVVELTDKNLAAIFSERGAAHGAGALVIVNRSIGVDQLQRRRPRTTLQDPAPSTGRIRFFTSTRSADRRSRRHRSARRHAGRLSQPVAAAERTARS